MGILKVWDNMDECLEVRDIWKFGETFILIQNNNQISRSRSLFHTLRSFFIIFLMYTTTYNIWYCHFEITATNPLHLLTCAFKRIVLYGPNIIQGNHWCTFYTRNRCLYNALFVWTVVNYDVMNIVLC